LYAEYWGFKEMPFENTPDPRFLYYSSQHEEGLTRMIHVVKGRKGAGMLTGVFGCGKTVLAQALLSELERNTYKVAFVTNPRLNDIEMLRMIIRLLEANDPAILGSTKPPLTKSDLWSTLNNMLINNMRESKETLVIIDEAHTIEDRSVFEEIRLLLNMHFANKFLLTLLLLGQTELKEKIDSNKQLAQRIAMRYHLDSLNENESLNYIIHRLGVAGPAAKLIFTDRAFKLIYEVSGGIPRVINKICDLSLFTGCSKKVDRIDAEIVREAIEILEGR